MSKEQQETLEIVQKKLRLAESELVSLKLKLEVTELKMKAAEENFNDTLKKVSDLDEDRTQKIADIAYYEERNDQQTTKIEALQKDLEFLREQNFNLEQS